ncbi:MAG: hypothetical protein IJ272_11275, partial [Clostridia bacterium]|nr:hypothetical protein [Clostridia bacterium]
NIEFADGTKGTLDYENVIINITTQGIVEEETIVNECVEELQTVYSNKESIEEKTVVTQKNEEVCELYDSSTGVNVDNMVNQLVQDMSEVTELTVSDSSELNNAATITDMCQLWD